MQDIFLPPGIQRRFFETFGTVPRQADAALAEAIAAVWQRRNQAPEAALDGIDHELAALGLAAMDLPLVQLVRRLHGRRRIITRAEMTALLATYSQAGGYLINGYVSDTAPAGLNGGPAPDHAAINAAIAREGAAYHRRAAIAWERTVRGITFISVGGGLRDGGARYDQPGSMNPSQYAEVSFCSTSMSPGSVVYIRQHCARLLLVSGDPTTDPPPPPTVFHHACDSGHRWQGDLDADTCPTCGGPSV